MTTKSYSTWIKWNGGECPVSPDTLVEVKFRRGISGQKLPAGDYCWRHLDCRNDIVSYRTVVEQPDLDAAEKLLLVYGYTITPPAKPLTFEDVVPMTEAPPEGTLYWAVHCFGKDGVEQFRWIDDDFYKSALRHRMAYLEKEHAVIAARQSVTDELRLAAKSAAPYGTAMIGASHLSHAADTIDNLRAQLAEAQREAVSLARSLFKRHYAQEPHYASGEIEWEPFNEPASVISQIDNMVAGMCAQLATVTAERDVLRAQLAEAQRDAERWRFFRHASVLPIDDKHPLSAFAERLTQGGVSIDDVDAVIDAARGGSNA